MKKSATHLTHHFVRHNRHILSIFVLLLLAFLLHFLNVQFAYANTLTNTNVEPASLVAGAVGSVTINFTTTGSIPANGKIRVRFGTGFTISGVTGANCSSMTGGFAVSYSSGSDNMVTISRDGTGVETLAGNAETCLIDGVKNPSGSGSTGLYAIQTLTVGMSNIDLNTSVTPDTIVPNVLTSTSVTPSVLTAGTSSTVTVNFTTVNPIQPTDMVRVSFPAGFTFGAMTASCSTMDGSFSVVTDLQIVKIVRSGGGVITPGPQTCVLTNVVTPGTAGTTAAYQLKVTDSTGSITRDQDLSVPGSTITSNGLVRGDVQPASLVTGETSTVTVTFTTTRELLSTDKIRVTFPAGFTFGVSAVSCSSGDVPFDGTLTYGVSSPTVGINRTGGTTQAPGLKVCTIRSVRNPETAGLTGDYTIRTYSASDALKDEVVAGGDVMVVPSNGGPVDIDFTDGTSSDSTSTRTDSNSSDSVQTLRAPMYSDALEVATRPVTVPSNGLILHPILLKAPTGASLFIRKATRVTTLNGAVYTGLLAPPVPVLQTKLPKALFKSLVYRRADSFGNNQPIFFDQDVFVSLPVPARVSARVLKLYFYNPAVADYQLLANGGTPSKDGTAITAAVNFLTTFVLAEVQPSVNSGTLSNESFSAGSVSGVRSSSLGQLLIPRTVPFKIFRPSTKIIK